MLHLVFFLLASVATDGAALDAMPQADANITDLRQGSGTQGSYNDNLNGRRATKERDLLRGRRAQVSNVARLAEEAPLHCGNGSDCVVEEGQVAVLTRSVDLRTLTVKGTLRWDASQDGLELRTGYTMVTGAGARLEVGTTSAPMEHKATIYIKDSGIPDPEDNSPCGVRFLCGKHGAYIGIHGCKLKRTWTLLTKTTEAGQLKLELKDDPSTMGWRAGDQIAIATTNRGNSYLGHVRTKELESALKDRNMGGLT